MNTASAPTHNPAPSTSGLAVASLVCSLLGLGLIGVICGHIALSTIKKSGDLIGGKGLAIAGLILGYLGIAAAIILALAMGTAIGGQAAKTETMNRALQLKNGVSTYFTEYRKYPSASDSGEDTKTPSDAALSRILMGEAGEGLNPRQIPFLIVKKSGIDEEGNLTDSWGTPFEVHMDTDHNNRVEIDGVQIPTGVAVRSAGPDKVFSTSDDIKTF